MGGFSFRFFAFLRVGMPHILPYFFESRCSFGSHQMEHVVVGGVGIGSGLRSGVFSIHFATRLVSCHWVVTGAKSILFLGCLRFRGVGIWRCRCFSFLLGLCCGYSLFSGGLGMGGLII